MTDPRDGGMRPGADDRLERRPAQVAFLPGSRCLVRGPEGVSLLAGVDAAELRRLLGRVDDGRTTAELFAGLPAVDAARVRRLLPHLLGDLLAVAPVSGSRPTARPRPRFLGNGPLARALADRLGDDGPAPLVGVRAFADAGSAEDGRWIGLEPAAAPPTEDLVDAWLDRPSQVALERAGADLSGGADLWVCAFENVPYAALFELQLALLVAGTASLFVASDPDALRLGPLTVPGLSACLACAQLAGLRALGLEPEAVFEALGRFRTERPGPAARETALALARRALDGGASELATSMLLLPTAGGGPRSYPVERIPGCPLCGALRATAAGDGPGSRLALRVEAAVVASRERSPRRAVRTLGGEAVRSVGVLGGGTAGYLTALSLARKVPGLAVTLIESSAIPIIGVGEATTPLLPQFLHADLGLDPADLFAAVEPTLKLGIRFDWGRPEVDHFNYPFGPVHVLEPQAYDGDVRRASLRSLLMSAGAAPLYAAGDELEAPFDTAVAYHLENRRFAAYLRRQALAAGVERIDAEIVRAELDPAGGEVRALVAEDGRRFSYDLYADCSGFRSLLMGEALGSPFVSFERGLLTDAAVVAAVPHGGRVRPYTLAETMTAGWCWATPMRDADHRGYVFASAFLDPGEAEAEMRRRNPGMGDARLVRFRAGRRRHFLSGNVAALGNAYGFVEPLESTALHMLVRQIGALLEAFPLGRGERGLAAVLNRRVGAAWDYLAWFLALHYRFNRRLDSPFWRHCREAVDVDEHGELLDVFRERGPLSYDRSARVSFDYPDPLWGAEGIDLLLLGQGVPCALPRPVMSRAAWAERARGMGARARRALPQAEALAILDRRPALVERLGRAFRDAGPAFRVA